MKLGFYTYSYIDRLKMSLEDVLHRVADAGYDGIDVSATWLDDLDPALMPADARRRYVRTAQKLGLHIEAVVTHLGLAQSIRDGLPINLKGAVDVARDLGAPVVTFHVGEDCDTPERSWSAVVDYLRDACDHAGRHGKLIALDGVWGPSLVSTPALAVQLAEEVGSPHFGHLYDPCYLAVSGFDLGEPTPLLPMTVHVHVKDHRGTYPDFQHLIPGEGVLDHGRYLRMLRGGLPRVRRQRVLHRRAAGPRHRRRLPHAGGGAAGLWGAGAGWELLQTGRGWPAARGMPERGQGMPATRVAKRRTS